MVESFVVWRTPVHAAVWVAGRVGVLIGCCCGKLVCLAAVATRFPFVASML